jgi:hypothetical protein
VAASLEGLRPRMSIADIIAKLNRLRLRWLYGVDPNERPLSEHDPRGSAGSQMRSVMIYLKDDHIYIFTMAFLGNGGHTLAGCRAQHAGDVAASVLGRDALVLMHASGGPMSSDEHRRRDDPLASVFGRRFDRRLCKRMGMVSVAQPRPAAGIHIGPHRFRGTTPFPAGNARTISKDADAEQIGQAILEKLRESQQMNA